MSTSRTIVVDLESAKALGPPEEGNLAVSVFAHGSLAVELYAPEDIDGQKPHSRDEVYIVAQGSGIFFDGENRAPVSQGSFVFVPAGQEHRFENFSRDFTVWVMFYGPEGGEADHEGLP